MNTTLHRVYLSINFSSLMLLAGCAAEQQKPNAAPTVPPTQKTASLSKNLSAPPSKASEATPSPAPAPPPVPKSALSEGIELYDAGDYNGAIRHLSSATEIWKGDKSSQVTALKFMAFSYCVTGRQTLCRQQFEKAFRLDRTFDLAPGEKGHPLWGPAFQRAKKLK